MDGVILTPLRQIPNPKGDVLHAIKKTDTGYCGFGEAYFSEINYNEIKGWKKHTVMVLNLVVPIGEVEFVLYDERPNSSSKGSFLEVTLSLSHYQRLTVPPGVWVAFKGVGNTRNMLLNIASIAHDPDEAENCALELIPYDWS
ncbi:dTDP-4-dehydrorhamnose 3,5-epimerase [Hydrogenovibrio sp. SC-1]|uniref:dTDP-4-dehydrorhamnose 3,5-epimerase n=1 Tax=Hydrogenovibrio sp. SC-1 TaxID=2065820 RepID=UPI000C7C5492|nr:dTDP-4-dehydrorhamnose 3,5-epimerase [Hydrogenovibrio sp. SC-1]PLA75551.1 dTDP-4-dehydrorhamnose 3,5-epimerase [Hydrogenovibrio sp. SC-1]